MVETNSYRILAEKLYEHCLEVELENERLVFRANKIKKELQRRGRDIELLKRRLDRYNDNWRSLPMVLPHPKRKIEQKRGPKPKTKTLNTSIPNACSDSQNTKDCMDKLKKVRQKRGRKTDKDTAMRQKEASLLRQKQQQQRQEMQKQRQREQQAIKLAAQQKRQLMREQKQLAAQQLKQQRQLQRQQQRFNVQQQRKQPTTHVVNNASTNAGIKTNLIQYEPRLNEKMSTTFLTPQRNPNTGGLTYSIIGENIMPPPPPPRKVDNAPEQPQHTQILLMHRPLQVTAVKNRQKIQ